MVVLAAIALHALVAPLIFTALAIHYFRARGAREPVSTALVWTGIVPVLDAGVVAGAVLRDFAMFTSFAGTWLPFGLILLTTWITGFLMSTMPWSKAEERGGRTRERGTGEDHGPNASLGRA